MNLITLEKPKASDISVDALIEYIQKKGWQEIHQPNQKLIVFQGKTDSLGKPIRMVLPENDQLCDSPLMLDKALNLLAAIENRTKREVVTEAMTSHKDVDNGLADHLSSLRSQYEQALSEAHTNASHLREQLSHVNALLLNQLLPSNGVVPQLTQSAAEVPVVEEISPAPAKSIAPAAEASASDRPNPKASKRKAKVPAAQAKAKPTIAPVKSRRSLEVLPAYRGMNKREAIAQILEQRSGEVLHQDMIIQSLYGDLSPQDVKDERVRIKTALLTGVKDGKWQKAFEPSSYFIKAPAASAKPKRPGRKPEPSKEPKPEPVAEASAQTKPATVKQRSSLDVLPAFEGMTKLDAIAAVLGQNLGEVLHQDTIIQTLYGDLSPEDLKKERVRIDTSLRNGVKANKWKKAPVPASYVLEAIAEPPAAKATAAKPKSVRKPAGAKVKASQKTARPKRKRSEVELVRLLRKADIEI
jgi:hypothetical protein